MQRHRHILSQLRVLWESGLNLLYPPLCTGCCCRLADPTQPLCLRCLRALERASSRDVQKQLERHPPHRQTLDSAFCLWRYDKGGILQHVHHRLKYSNRPAYGRHLGAVLGTAYRQTADTPIHLDALLAVPLHPTRRYERGYNQSLELAEGMQDVLRLPILQQAVHRSWATRTQTELSREDRWHNVSGAFSVEAPELVAGSHLLLVDDVMTTGATALAVAAILKKHEAATVHLAALALTR